MRKTEAIRARVAPRLTRKAEAIPKEVERKPTAATKRALREARARKNLETFDTFSEWAKWAKSVSER
jgi:hypothetical protein